ncbi:MAG: hypothetical protein AAF657_20825 [Acidobacteriota bacterium]
MTYQQPKSASVPASQPRRRDVLLAGASLLLAPAVPAWGARPTAPDLALGYLPASSEGKSERWAVPAQRLASGDPQMALGGARVTVAGLLGEPSRLHRRGIHAIDLWLRFDAEETVASPVDVLIWSYRTLPVANVASPVRCAVPVTGGLTVALELGGPWRERFETRLSLGREAGEAKLRAGRYLLLPGAAAQPSQRFDSASSEPYIDLSIESSASVDGRASAS